MTGWQLLGAVLMALPLLAIFCMTAKEEGVAFAARLALFTASVVGIVVLGAALLAGDIP